MELTKHAYKIKELRKKLLFNDALLYYKNNVAKPFPKDIIKQNQWLVADILLCLRKIDKSAEAIQFFAHHLKIKTAEIDNIRLRSELGWNLFAILKNNQNSPHFDQLSVTFLSILDPKKDELLFSALFWKLINREYEKMLPKLGIIQQVLNRLEPENLSDKIQKITTTIKGQQKTIILPSDRQRWYIETSKVLYLTKNYDKCIKCIERGFEKAKDFSPDNQFWLLRRKYLAMAELGKYENAIEGLKQLINTKSDWFLFKDLSEIFFRDNNKEMALSNACIASILPGKIDYKVSLFSYMAINLVQQKQAPMHHWIVNQIKEKNNWKISSLNQESNPRQENSGYSAKQLFEFWIDQLKISGRLKKGKITKILHQGNKGDGFIEQANGQLVYFKSTDIIGNVRHLSEGCKVFFLKKSKQFKGKTSFQAYGILLADNDEKIRGIDKLIVI